jgi:rfaE bifunctional protein nucleotidyltransferase chain/domain
MKTVLTHGCFDIIHTRHIRLLKYARSLGDELVVSLLADEYVRKYKGEKRPVHPLDMRIEHMKELRCVDRVVVVDGPGHEAVQDMLEMVRPSIYLKGGECIGRMPEEAFAKSLGIEVVFMEMEHDMTRKKQFEKLFSEYRD